ncbi:hypothetical protein TNIN_394961 [Trichonephila inaurata madagascariensis]|uniref:MATH domain-containing protein n=1 Tax=Trichonephila inaurata madagascariensis TaxID=2747483 RepID=A0A8X6XJ10_9ARAC|nr:hypothetical protein TNIN_394961 [Trichonephila inaurata madagascariensis]
MTDYLSDMECENSDEECESSDEEYEFIMWWNIENYLYCWQKHEKFSSPLFTATSMENTKWCLYLFPAGKNNENENYIACYLNRMRNNGPEKIKVKFVLEILGSDGSVLTEKYSAKCAFDKRICLGLERIY